MISETRKSELIVEYRTHPTDTGSAEVQVAILTERIKEITSHLHSHRKDVRGRLGLLKLVGKRRRLLTYVTREDVARYRSLISRLGLRR